MDKKLFELISESADFKQIKAEMANAQGQCYCIMNADKFLRESFLEVLLCSVYCEREMSPCGQCNRCKQVENKNNIDICYFGEDEGLVKKESIERLLESAITKPYEFSRKFLIVKNGDGLSEQGQNMLLKMLEELPAFDTVIILCSGTQKILPTIRSRSRNFLLHSLGASALVQIIGSSERSLNIIKCTDANFGKAIALDKTKEFDDMYKYALTILFNFEKKADYTNYSGYLQRNREKLELILYIMKGVFYMALKGDIDCTLPKIKLAKIVEHISYLEINLLKRQNKLMVIDDLLMGILKIKNEVK
ncbi:MAG: hypothetical protein IJZ29_01835 [Clostridia bacterium]|nr:hypothetical protein [Clostridia bacterium]